MIRTGQQYREGLDPAREVHIDGERVRDLAGHPAFRPLIELRARIYDMQHEAAHRDILTVTEDGETGTVAARPPVSQADWWAKRRATDRILTELGGVVARVGDETIGEIWSLADAAEGLAALDPKLAPNVQGWIARVQAEDRFLVSANADPRGNRARPPAQQDPDVLLHVVRETDAGVVVRGAKFETAAPYADLAYTKPTIANWGEEADSPYAFGFICDLNARGLKFICRSGLARPGTARDYPLSNRFDEIEALVVFDDVLVPWENLLFYRSTRAARHVRATLHRYSAFAFVQRILKLADLMIGAALLSLRQTGLDGEQGVQEKLARLAVWREGINAHLTAAVALGEKSPSGLMMPNQALLYAGRVQAVEPLPQMMALVRELCGGQIALVPDAAAFEAEATRPWLDKYFGIGPEWLAEDRRKLLAFARDLVSSGHADHRLSFQLFAQSPPHTHLAAVYRNFDWEGPMALVREAAQLAPRVMGPQTRTQPDSAISGWFSGRLPRQRPPLPDLD